VVGYRRPQKQRNSQRPGVREERMESGGQQCTYVAMRQRNNGTPGVGLPVRARTYGGAIPDPFPMRSGADRVLDPRP